jgi:hypothetical protein
MVASKNLEIKRSMPAVCDWADAEKLKYLTVSKSIALVDETAAIEAEKDLKTDKLIESVEVFAEATAPKMPRFIFADIFETSDAAIADAKNWIVDSISIGPVEVWPVIEIDNCRKTEKSILSVDDSADIDAENCRLKIRSISPVEVAPVESAENLGFLSRSTAEHAEAAEIEAEKYLIIARSMAPVWLAAKIDADSFRLIFKAIPAVEVVATIKAEKARAELKSMLAV